MTLLLHESSVLILNYSALQVFRLRQYCAGKTQFSFEHTLYKFVEPEKVCEWD